MFTKAYICKGAVLITKNYPYLLDGSIDNRDTKHDIKMYPVQIAQTQKLCL